MKKFGFGLMRLPQKNAADYGQVDLEAFIRMADAYMAEGFNYFDTGYPYHAGNSETAFREAVSKRYPRDSFMIADKLPMFQITTEKEMSDIFDEQLKRCGVDFFDYYLLHALGEDSYKRCETLHAFDFVARKKEEGKIKHIGFSFHDSPELLDDILTNHPEMEYVQLQVNYIDWDDPTIRARECYDIAVKHKKPVIVMEPVKGGSLAQVPKEAEDLFKEQAPGMSAASWAIRYAASLEHVMMVLSGPSTQEQLTDTMGFMKAFRPLDEKERQTIAKAAKLIRKSIAIPCTACRYCVDECPKKIAIPEYFAIYNNLKLFGPAQTIVAVTYYANLTEKHGKASDCIACGRCEKHCPQHLPIIDEMKTVAKALEKT